MKKVEVQPDQVTIYLDEVRWGQQQEPWDVGGGFPHCGWLYLPLGLSPQLTKEETFSFQAQQDFLVSNLQPATVSLYDYYETGEPCRAVSLALLPALQPQGLSGTCLISQLLPDPWSPPLPLQVTVWMWPTLHPPAQVGAEPARPGVPPSSGL